MNDLKELVKLYKEHPMLIVITLVSMVIGAILGAVAFYNGWLGKNKFRSIFLFTLSYFSASINAT